MAHLTNLRSAHVTSTPVWGVLVTLPNGSKLLPPFRGNMDAARLGAALATAAGYKSAQAVPVTPALLKNITK